MVGMDPVASFTYFCKPSFTPLPPRYISAMRCVLANEQKTDDAYNAFITWRNHA